MYISCKYMYKIQRRLYCYRRRRNIVLDSMVTTYVVDKPQNRHKKVFSVL